MRLYAKTGRRGCVVVNGVAGPEYDNVGQPAMSADGRVVAYRAERGDKSLIRIGNREEPEFDFVSEPVVSADGSTVAYAAEHENGAWILHVGDRQTPIEDQPTLLFISDDGRHVGWVVTEFKPSGGSVQRVVANGKKGEAFGIVGKPVFSPVEPLVAYGAEDAGRKYVVFEDRKVETPERMSDPSFSRDGRRVGYGALVGRELWWKVFEVRGPHLGGK